MGRYGPPARPLRERFRTLGLPAPAASTGISRAGLGLKGELVRRGATSVTSGPPTALVEKDGFKFWRYADGTHLPAHPDEVARMLTQGSTSTGGTLSLGTSTGDRSPGSSYLPPADPAELAPSDVAGRVHAALDGMVIGDWAGIHSLPRRADHPRVTGIGSGFKPQLQTPSLYDLPRDPRIHP